MASDDKAAKALQRFSRGLLARKSFKEAKAERQLYNEKEGIF